VSRSRQVDVDIEGDPAAFEHENVVGEHHRFCDVVSNEDRRESLPQPDDFEQSLHFDTRQRIKRAERFVKCEQTWPAYQCAGKCHSLLLPTREDRRPVIGAVGQAHGSERRKRTIAPSGRPEANLDIGHNACPRQQSRLLEHETHWWRTSAGGQAPKEICPASGRSSPASKRKSVLLPHPLRPTMARNWPADAWRSRSRTTHVAPKFLVRPRTIIDVPGAGELWEETSKADQLAAGTAMVISAHF
jgi:hypothetical protein